jgi:hypothetical protein
MEYLPLFLPLTRSTHARVKICRGSDGVVLWDVSFRSCDPIPQPPLDLNLAQYKEWGGYRVYLEWSE